MSETTLAAALAYTWQDYARQFPVPRGRVGMVMTMEKSAGYTHVRRNSSQNARVPQLVPRMLLRLMPTVRIIVLLRDPVSMVRSRFSQCQRQIAKHRSSTMRTKCGGSTDQDFETMLVGSGIAWIDEAQRPLSAGLNAQQVLAARMGGPQGLLLIEDPLEMLSLWSEEMAQAGGQSSQLLVLFTELLSTDPKGVMNSVLRHVGLENFDWPSAQRVPNSTRITYSIVRSKSVAHSYRPLTSDWSKLLRDVYTPVIRKFKAVLPCLGAPWNESDNVVESLETHSFTQKEFKLHSRLCPLQGLKAMSQLHVPSHTPMQSVALDITI
eukprot:CAMPEP_0119322434 /NCGR_PEP_ID=MMETSP1333-20130426/58186_1 /TAXON_ID=418940 /ORGANISM="Scyphosphaera apsteinii, Strain RCC1455" /LENGTH=322 /DNA_ID=CAMNT_0007329669 /DNA_START=340 /DNA_END=1308 /DNA_ORIENTATION=+